MTPYYITGAFCLTAMASFWFGRQTMKEEIEEYFDELTEKAKDAVLLKQNDAQK